MNTSPRTKAEDAKTREPNFDHLMEKHLRCEITITEFATLVWKMAYSAGWNDAILTTAQHEPQRRSR